jgi:hypothetical protein
MLLLNKIFVHSFVNKYRERIFYIKYQRQKSLTSLTDNQLHFTFTYITVQILVLIVSLLYD